MKTITEKEMLRQFHGVNTRNEVELIELGMESHDFSYVDANGLNDVNFLMDYYDVDTVEEMVEIHERQLEIAQQTCWIVSLLEEKLHVNK